MEVQVCAVVDTLVSVVHGDSAREDTKDHRHLQPAPAWAGQRVNTTRPNMVQVDPLGCMWEMTNAVLRGLSAD